MLCDVTIALFCRGSKLKKSRRILLSICVSMCEILGIQANLSQARNRDLCEHDLGLSLPSFDSTEVSDV